MAAISTLPTLSLPSPATFSPLPAQDELNSQIMPHFLAGVLLGQFSVSDWPRNPQTEKKTTIRSDDVVTALGMVLNYDSRFCYIRSTGVCYLNVPGTKVYLRCPDERLTEMVSTRWTQNMALLGSPNPARIRDAVTMVKTYAKERMDTISRRYIAVTHELYWDTEEANLTDTPESPVFYRLFDSDEETLHIRKVPPFTPGQVQTLKDDFNRILRYQEEHDGDLPEEFPFVQLWANFSHDLYTDILKASACPFIRRKPMGAFMPIGLKRNGKTAWSNDFMKTMLGLNNTSAVQMANLGNPHQTRKLQWTLYNAPDEEREVPTKFIEEFKTICDHGHLDMDQFFKQDPIPITCDFVCVCPMNTEPQWAAQGVAPLVARSFVMPFTHDFKEEDPEPIPFPERTFTAEMFSHMLGTLFAIAAYYRTRTLTFSEEVMSYQRTLEAETSSHITYFEHFIAFFDGFQSIKQIYEDYKIWCSSTAHECVPVAQGPFKLAFGEFTKKEHRTNASINGVKAKVNRIPRPTMSPLISGVRYRGKKEKIGSIEELHDGSVPMSIVERMEADLEAIYKDEYEEELRRRVLSAKRFIDGQKEVSPPPPSIPAEQPSFNDDIFGKDLS